MNATNPKPKEKPWGYDVTIEFQKGAQRYTEEHHKQGSESKVRRWALMKPHARAVLELRPYTREEWIRAWGDGRLRM